MYSLVFNLEPWKFYSVSSTVFIILRLNLSVLLVILNCSTIYSNFKILSSKSQYLSLSSAFYRRNFPQNWNFIQNTQRHTHIFQTFHIKIFVFSFSKSFFTMLDFLRQDPPVKYWNPIIFNISNDLPAYLDMSPFNLELNYSGLLWWALVFYTRRMIKIKSLKTQIWECKTMRFSVKRSVK